MSVIEETFGIRVNYFINTDELTHFAATWGIQNSPAVRFRIIERKNLEYGAEFIKNK